MRVFDLHCDMIPACLEHGYDLMQNEAQLDLQRGKHFERWIQTFAFWMDDSCHGEDAWKMFCHQYELFLGFCRRYPDSLKFVSNLCSEPLPGCNAVLSIENGCVLGGDLNRIAQLKSFGISFFSLTWNGKNELASGAHESGGLTGLGKEAVKELERENIIIDVSHLNDQGFEDLMKLSHKPVIATHSNARSVCKNARNLTDEQIGVIAKSGGVIGLNFYAPFVNGQNSYQFSDLFLHIERILQYGGEDVPALGTDFGVTEIPQILSDIKKLENLYQSMIEYFGKELTEKIFYQNAKSFVSRNIVIKGKGKNVIS